jgi:hypothetical protein
MLWFWRVYELHWPFCSITVSTILDMACIFTSSDTAQHSYYPDHVVQRQTVYNWSWHSLTCFLPFRCSRKLKLFYVRQLVGQSVLVPGNHLGPVTNFFSLLEIFFRQLQDCYFVAPSLVRGQVQLLLVLVRAVTLGSKSRRTHSQVLLSHLRPCDPSSPLTTRRDYGGGILPASTRGGEVWSWS